MKFDPQKHNRRSIRLKGYDYSRPGAYFVTLCTYKRECFLGEVVSDEVRLSDAGRVVWEIWGSLDKRYTNVALDQAIVMPNHFHGILRIKEAEVGAIHESPQPESPHFKDMVHYFWQVARCLLGKKGAWEYARIYWLHGQEDTYLYLWQRLRPDGATSGDEVKIARTDNNLIPEDVWSFVAKKGLDGWEVFEM